jgi:hypothetical protein
MKPEEITIELSGMIDNPEVISMPNGVDHLNWIELGKQKENGFDCVIVSYAPAFGWLWRSGQITREEALKAGKGKKFKWTSDGLCGHGCP